MLFKLERDRDAELLKAGYLNHGELDRQLQWALPVEPLLEQYLDELNIKRKRTGPYVAECGRRVRRYLREQGVDRLADMETPSIKAFLDRNLAAGWGAITFNAFRADLLAFSRWLVDFKHLPENPVRMIRTMDPRDEAPRRPSRALTLPECDALLRATPCLRRRALYLLRLWTGLRVKEGGRLRWSDLDLVGAVLTMPGRRAGKLNTKNKREAILPLTPVVCDALGQLQRNLLREGQPAQPDDLVFPGVVHADTFDRDLALAGVEKRIDGEVATPKALRKTLDTLLLRASVDPIDVLLIMRHKLPAGMDLTLGVYADKGALLGRKRAAIQKLTSWIAEQRQARRKQA